MNPLSFCQRLLPFACGAAAGGRKETLPFLALPLPFCHQRLLPLPAVLRCALTFWKIATLSGEIPSLMCFGTLRGSDEEDGLRRTVAPVAAIQCIAKCCQMALLLLGVASRGGGE